MKISQKPTDILRNEHKEVLKKLDALEDVFRRLDDKEAVTSQLEELTSFFNTDFWIHFSKEEEALFPEIEKFIPREGGPTGMMLIEHEDLRNTNDEIQKAVSQYLGGSESEETKQTIQRHGNIFIGTLRPHIEKEDSMLFMMADMHLDEAQTETVLRRFEELENSKGK